MRTFSQYITEAVTAAEHELNAPSHALLLKHGYENTGNRMKEKSRQFNYVHPKTKHSVKTFINPHANSEQQVQHHFGNEWTHHSALADRLKANR